MKHHSTIDYAFITSFKKAFEPGLVQTVHNIDPNLKVILDTVDFGQMLRVTIRDTTNNYSVGISISREMIADDQYNKIKYEVEHLVGRILDARVTIPVDEIRGALGRSE